MTNEAFDQGRTTFLNCLRTLLRPALKFCLKRGLKIGDIVECAKATFIEIAAEQIEKEHGRQASISRISLITGVQRPEVVRIHKKGLVGKEESSITAKVLGRWKQSAEYLTSRGQPRILTAEGSDSEFCQLVRSVNSHMNPYTVLFELERIKAVERSPNGLRLKTAIFVPTGDLEQGARLMAGDAEDMMEAIEENLASPDAPPNYHLVTDYENIAVESVPAIQSWITEQSIRFHEEAQKFLASHDRDVNPALKDKDAGVRVLVGGFSRVVRPRNPVLVGEVVQPAGETGGDVSVAPRNDD